MSWRVVVISKRAKLEFRQNYLVCRDENETLIHLSEIGTLIVENTAVALTAALINELIKNKIKVIFCDEKRNPLCELSPYYDNYNTSFCIPMQINWKKQTSLMVWTNIVHRKIYNQCLLLKQLNRPEEKLLSEYLNQIVLGGATNREGHAAKVYFNAIFGQQFNRNNCDNINSALNYGYTILLSAFNREIVACGYLTQLGIFHNNSLNQFNLSCDLMEPFRVLVDKVVLENFDSVFDASYKQKLISILNQKVNIDNKSHFVSNAIKIYVQSVLNALNKNNVSLIKHYEL